MEVSAYEGTNIDALMQTIVDQGIEWNIEKQENGGKHPGRPECVSYW